MATSILIKVIMYNKIVVNSAIKSMYVIAKIYKFIPVSLTFPRETLLFGGTLLLAQLIIFQGNPLIQEALLFGKSE